MKRLIFTLILATICGLSAFAYDFSAVCNSGQTLYYSISSSTSPYTVKVVRQNSGQPYYSPYPTGNLTIPSSVTYNSITYSVTSISSGAFQYCNGLTSVTIPNSVTSIGQLAFAYCSGLTSVTIPNSVTSIGGEAFEYCSGLTSVSIPSSVTSIGGHAFSGCSGLVDITIPFVGSSATATTASSLTLFGYIFGYTSYTGGTAVEQYYGTGTNLTKTYYIPSNLRSVTVTGGNMLYGAFYGCSMLTSVTISNSVTSIGEKAFYYCSGLTSVAISSNSVTSIGEKAFYNCSGLTSVAISSNSVTSIGDYAFYNCSGLTSVTIPNSVTSLGQMAFAYCSGLASVTIGNGVTSIGSGAFSGCSGLVDMTIPFVGSSATATTTSASTLFGYLFGTTSYTGGTAVEQKYGSGTSQKKTYYIPSNLRSVTVTGGIMLYGAFSRCSMLTSVTILNSVRSIGQKAFAGCNGLVDMTIPFVGGNATATTASESTLFGYIFEYSTYSSSSSSTQPTGTIRQLYQSGSFAYGIYAYIPSSLRSVTVTGGNLLRGAFSNCSMLTSVTIPDSITSIGQAAFNGCSGLTSFTIPNSVTSIGNSAFYGCSGLTEVTIPNSVTSISESTFSNCSGLTSVTIPNSVTSIGNYAFQSCSGLTEVAIGNSVTSIGYEAFRDCSGLTSVTIGNSVTNIGQRAFYNCSGLTDIYANPTTPPSASSYSFNNVSVSATLWVPCGSAAAYREADVWSNFSDIREMLPYTLNVASADLTMGNASITQQPNCNDGIAIITATPIRGYAFSQWNDGNTDNPRTVTVTADVEYTASFVALPAYTITAVSADETGGSVNGGGTYYEGETATLTATANDDYVFDSWTDGKTDNPRTVTVTGNATFTATFKAWRTITVISANETQGTVSGSGTYLEDAEIEISATPAAHYHFTQWNDGNTDNPRTITVTSDSTFTASFAIDQHTVTVESADTEMGTVSEGGTYDYGTEIQISATPAEGYGFVAWNDGNTDNPRTITVTEDITYTATFGAWRTITVLSADETMGTVSGGGVYVEGAQVEISAEAVEHYHFAQWNDGNTDNPRTITVTGDATYTASFAIDRFTITVESANEAMGTVSESNSYDYGAEIQISATASNGYHFAQWSDGNTDNPRTITVTGDATYIATFAPNNYTIVVRSLNEDWGTVSEGGTFPYGTEIQISATPRENYAFVAWTDGNTDNPRTITVVADAEYAAAFTWSVGIDETAVSEIALFPNPATDILNITSSETISEIEIVNTLGQVVKRIEVNSDNAVCNVEGLTSGVYVVRIRTLRQAQGAALRKFIKE